MLVLDPQKRYTIEQIKKHSWMMEEAPRLLPSAGGGGRSEPNEVILELMQEMGIDAGRTKEVSSSMTKYIIIFRRNPMADLQVNVKSIAQFIHHCANFRPTISNWEESNKMYLLMR